MQQIVPGKNYAIPDDFPLRWLVHKEYFYIFIMAYILVILSM